MKCEEELEGGLNIRSVVCGINTASCITVYTKNWLKQKCSYKCIKHNVDIGMCAVHRVHFHGNLLLCVMLSHCRDEKNSNQTMCCCHCGHLAQVPVHRKVRVKTQGYFTERLMNWTGIKNQIKTWSLVNVSVLHLVCTYTIHSETKWMNQNVYNPQYDSMDESQLCDTCFSPTWIPGRCRKVPSDCFRWRTFFILSVLCSNIIVDLLFFTFEMMLQQGVAALFVWISLLA